MQITRFGDAQAYEVPGHHDVRTLRLQGFDASNSKFAWAGEEMAALRRQLAEHLVTSQRERNSS